MVVSWHSYLGDGGVYQGVDLEAGWGVDMEVGWGIAVMDMGVGVVLSKRAERCLPREIDQ